MPPDLPGKIQLALSLQASLLLAACAVPARPTNQILPFRATLLPRQTTSHESTNQPYSKPSKETSRRQEGHRTFRSWISSIERPSENIRRPAGEIPCICSTATATHPPGRAACDSKGTNGTSSPSRLATILLHSGSSDPFWGARSSFLSLVGKIGGAGFILLPADADCLLVLSASLTIQHMHESYGFSRVAIFWAKSRGQKRSTVSD